MILAYVPCRIKSTRLPNKALKKIAGIASIERTLINTMAIPGIDKVILATSTNKEDDILEDCNLNGIVEVVRGAEIDVLDRFMPTIYKYNPDHIVRVTGDCPLVAPELCDYIIQSHLKNKVDVSFTLSKIALGSACEIYKTEAVYRLRELFPQTNYSEYLIYYFLNNPDYFSLNIINAPSWFLRPYRLTLDEENDLELFNSIFDTIKPGLRGVLFSEVIDFFNQNLVKYKDDLELINHLKIATTYTYK